MTNLNYQRGVRHLVSYVSAINNPLTFSCGMKLYIVFQDECSKVALLKGCQFVASVGCKRTGKKVLSFVLLLNFGIRKQKTNGIQINLHNWKTEKWHKGSGAAFPFTSHLIGGGKPLQTLEFSISDCGWILNGRQKQMLLAEVDIRGAHLSGVAVRDTYSGAPVEKKNGCCILH